MTYTPAYRLLGFSSYAEYLDSEEWRATKWRIYTQYPYSRYCWICDKTTDINLHHENYWAMPKEKFMKDVFWICRRCHHKIHFRVDKSGNEVKVDLEKEALQQRRLELRREYIRQNLKPSTLLPFLKVFAYRLLW